MVVITNPDPDIFVTDDDVKQFFANEGIDITGIRLRISRGPNGKITEIEVNTALTAPQQDAFKAQFFSSSVETIIALIAAINNPPNMTIYLSDQTPDSPITIPISASKTPTDILVPDNWWEQADFLDFEIVDDDTGEIKYIGDHNIIVTINYSGTIAAGGENIFLTIMRKIDGESYLEQTGSRMYSFSSNSNDGQTVSGNMTLRLQPNDTIKLNVGNYDNDDDIQITTATMSVL